MKVRVTFKTPGVLDDVVSNQSEEAIDEALEFVKKYVKYEEYVTIEFDTEAKTATVLPVSR
jgi:uncharacterized protein YerC